MSPVAEHHHNKNIAQTAAKRRNIIWLEILLTDYLRNRQSQFNKKEQD